MLTFFTKTLPTLKVVIKIIIPERPDTDIKDTYVTKD